MKHTPCASRARLFYYCNNFSVIFILNPHQLQVFEIKT
ncbi:hypothetical protein FMH15_01265 [Vibrio alginolyticus]|nr:hypothetical protein [Vibrio alginolyticus]QIR87319.1 hypothetical protein FQ332_00835 [Vibrio diabolicus]